MRKNDLVKCIAEKTGVDQVDVLVTLEAFMVIVKEQVSSGDKVSLRRFGTFGIKRRKAKVARDIKRGMPVNLPARNAPAFMPAKVWVEELKKRG